eukprot:CAMPEP_0113403266 /NCGR_PEP_ID=MMETSP0013_2-20120614/17731_1 /TAXON_ID=2843 ORGANISM="Skeletonema costatum, Strain 1716" /NCGR_SAMPLE_ID=MMETSP0013_2 /ASSEMBLY_ACC=CAM_ASM_000158 /LENGTH=1141 /DNA_ID=CAMNT_0000288723 /DNA_START=79 /DNA_END=3504 /DNA_ORIENTATION=+ /assembly_acc=CAM_ASM_000158
MMESNNSFFTNAAVATTSTSTQQGRAHQQQQHHYGGPAPPQAQQNHLPQTQQHQNNVAAYPEQQQQQFIAYASTNNNNVVPQQSPQLQPINPNNGHHHPTAAANNTTVISYHQATVAPSAGAAAAAAVSMHGGYQQQQQQQQAAMMMPQRSRPCVRCGYPGCDVMITACRCCLHARCAPIPIRTCPNPRCMHPRMELMNNTTTNGNTNESRPSHPLELLPMEFDELDESRRVATLTEAASRRAKEKQRARKKAKLESNVMAGQQQQHQNNNGSSSNVTLSTANSSGSTAGGGMEGDNGNGGQFPDDISIDSQSMMNNNHPQQQQQQQLPTPDNQMSMSSNNSIRSSTSTTTTDTSLLSSSSTALPSSSSTAPIIAGGISPELRTGRWTAEETHYCDTLVSKFMAGRLPLPDGIKLNEFLSSMLKSKQSRLTKKMKNAKLSSKTFRRTTGYLTSELEAREYSEAEDAFFHSLQNQLERCEMRFHTRKEWRETFSTYCVSHGQMLNADAWLVSIDEMDRRVHRAKDRMRMERRKLMMGHALRHDLKNPNRGVVIDKVNNDVNCGGSGGDYGGSMSGGSVTGNGDNGGGIGASSASSCNGSNNNLMDSNANGQYSSYSMSGNDPMLAADQQQQPQQLHQFEMDQQRARARSLSFALDGVGQSMASPFLNRIINFIHRHHIPFEYVDAWVPSFVPDGKDSSADGGDGSQGGGESVASGQQQQQMKPDQDVDLHSNSGEQKQQQPQPKCRLCFAGSIGAKQVIVGGDGTNQYRRAVPLSSDDQFNLAAFGDYSESFSFDVGCGLPGRVYHMGVPTWEQSVHNAPLHHFERVGGSQQWGIRTVVGIPVPSPNVGRVVVILYSRHDRPKDHDMVIRLTDEFTRLLPSPKWKLVVDVGQQQQQQQQVAQQEQQQQQQQQDLTAAAPPSEDPAALSSEVISIFGEHMPSDPNSPAFAYLQGFMSLRLLLLRQNRGGQEQDLVNTMLSSYSSYKAGGRTPADIALMLARDFMFLSQQQQQQQQQSNVSSPHGNHQFSQPAQYQQQPAVQNNGVHVSASPRLQPASPNNGSSMPPPSYHSSTSLMQPQQVNQEQDRLQHSFQEALVNGTVSNMLLGGDDDVAPTPVSEMINAAAAAAVSAAAADGGLGSLAS